MERVLVVGATGNIGVSATIAALRSGRQVLAAVRNQASANKLFKHVGTTEGIKTIEADVTSDSGVKGIVNLVKAGKLPAFQHVYACAGGAFGLNRLKDIDTETLRRDMNVCFESNFFAYRDTIEYLLEQKQTDCTWTVCTGSQGETGEFPLPAMTQGSLFSMVTGAARENEKTNVRVNEVYLACRVEVDEDARQHGVSSSSEFASVYEGILARPEIRGSRVSVETPADFHNLKFARKF